MGSIVALQQATPESGDRAEVHDRTTEDDDSAAERVEGPKGIRPMFDAPKALPDEHIYMCFDPDVAKEPKGLSSSGRQDRSNASGSHGERGRTRPRKAHPLRAQSACQS